MAENDALEKQKQQPLQQPQMPMQQPVQPMAFQQPQPGPTPMSYQRQPAPAPQQPVYVARSAASTYGRSNGYSKVSNMYNSTSRIFTFLQLFNLKLNLLTSITRSTD